MNAHGLAAPQMLHTLKHQAAGHQEPDGVGERLPDVRVAVSHVVELLQDGEARGMKPEVMHQVADHNFENTTMATPESDQLLKRPCQSPAPLGGVPQSPSKSVENHPQEREERRIGLEVPQREPPVVKLSQHLRIEEVHLLARDADQVGVADVGRGEGLWPRADHWVSAVRDQRRS